MESDKKYINNERIRNSSKSREALSTTQKPKNSFNSYSQRIVEDYKKIINYNNKNYIHKEKSEKKIYSIPQNSDAALDIIDEISALEMNIPEKIHQEKSEKNPFIIEKIPQQKIKINQPLVKTSYKELRNNYKNNSTFSKNSNVISVPKHTTKDKDGEIIKNIKKELNEISESIQSTEHKISMRSSSTSRIRLDNYPVKNLQTAENVEKDFEKISEKNLLYNEKNYQLASSTQNGLLKNLEEKNKSIAKELKEIEEKYQEVVNTKETLFENDKKNFNVENENFPKNFYFSQYEIEDDSVILQCKEKLSKIEDDKENAIAQGKDKILRLQNEVRELNEENKNLKIEVENFKSKIKNYFPCLEEDFENSTLKTNFEILYSFSSEKIFSELDEKIVWFFILMKNSKISQNGFWIREEDLKKKISEEKLEKIFCNSTNLKSFNDIETKYESLKKNFLQFSELKNSELKTSNLENAKLKSHIVQINLQNKNLSENISKLKNDLEEKINSFAKREEKFKEVNEKLKFYQNEYFNFEIKFKNEIQNSEAEKKILKEKILLLENSANSLQIEIRNLEEKNLNLQKEKISEICGKSHIKEKTENHEDFEISEKVLSELKSEIEKLNSEILNEQKINSNLKQEIKSLHEQIENIPNVINNEIKKLKMKFKLDSTEVVQIIEKNKFLQIKNEELLENLVKFNQSYSELEKMKNALEEEKKQNLIQIEILSKQMKTLNSKFEERSVKINDMMKDKNILESIINELKSENEGLKSEIIELDKKVEKFEFAKNQFESLKKEKKSEFEICKNEGFDMVKGKNFLKKFTKCEVCQIQNFDLIIKVQNDLRNVDNDLGQYNKLSYNKVCEISFKNNKKHLNEVIFEIEIEILNKNKNRDDDGKIIKALNKFSSDFNEVCKIQEIQFLNTKEFLEKKFKIIQFYNLEILSQYEKYKHRPNEICLTVEFEFSNVKVFRNENFKNEYFEFIAEKKIRSKYMIQKLQNLEIISDYSFAKEHQKISEEILSLKGQKESSMYEIIANKQQIAELIEKLNQTEKIYEDEISSLKDKITIQENEIISNSKDQQQLQNKLIIEKEENLKQVTYLNYTIENLQKQLDEIKRKLIDSNIQIEEYQKHIEEKKKIINEQNKQLENYQIEIQQNFIDYKRIEKLQDEILNLKNNFEVNSDLIQEKEKILNEKNIQMEYLLEEIKTLKENNKKLAEEELESRLVHQELEMRIERLNDEIQKLSDQNLTLRRDLNKKNLSSKNLNKNQNENQEIPDILNLKIENEILKEEIKKKEDLIMEMKEEIIKLESQIQKANEKFLSEASVMTENSETEKNKKLSSKRLNSFLLTENSNSTNNTSNDDTSSLSLEEKIDKYKKSVFELEGYNKTVLKQISFLRYEMKKVLRNSEASKVYESKINNYEELNKLISEILDYFSPPNTEIRNSINKLKNHFDSN